MFVDDRLGTRQPFSSWKKTTFRSVAACLTLLLLATTAFGDAASYRKALRGTTWVVCQGSEGLSQGTGVLVDAERRLVITNAHVVGDNRSVLVFFPLIKGDAPVVERKYYFANASKLSIRGKVRSVDRKRDLALIELDRVPQNAAAIPLAANSVSPGEPIESIGNPGASGALWVYTSGSVRSVYQKKFSSGSGKHDFRVVETQSPTNTGDSGGPVINRDGELVAISQGYLPRANLISFGVDVAEIKDFIAEDWKPAPLSVAALLDTADLEYSRDANGHYRVAFPRKPLPDDSPQPEDDSSRLDVLISADYELYQAAEVRKVWALASKPGPLPQPQTLQELLEQNARTKLGAWTLEQASDGRYMMMYVAKVDATASHESLASTIEYVARITQNMQQKLEPKPEVKTAGSTLNAWLPKP